MIDLSVLIQVELQILIFFLLGMMLKKKKITDSHIDEFLSVLILNLIMPMNVFLSFYHNVSITVLQESFLLIVVGMIVVGAVLLCSLAMPKTMPMDKRRIAQYSMLISNGALIGLPLIEGLCGSAGVVYANIFMIPTRILSFSTGKKYFSAEAKNNGVMETMKSFFLNPITVAMILGFGLNWLQLTIPFGVSAVITGLSGCMSPLALILVGSTLMESPSLKETVSLDILEISFFRLIIAPLLTCVVGMVMGLSPLQLIAAVLVNAAPVASTATIFAKRYNGNTGYTSSCVFLSTILSLVTLWFVCATMTWL